MRGKMQCDQDVMMGNLGYEHYNDDTLVLLLQEYDKLMLHA